MSGDYRIDALTEGWYALIHHTENRLVQLSLEELAAFHKLSGEILKCTDCPCYQAGFEHGVETPHEPQRSRA